MQFLIGTILCIENIDNAENNYGKFSIIQRFNQLILYTRVFQLVLQNFI